MTTKTPHSLAEIRAARLTALAEISQLSVAQRGQDEARAEVASYLQHAAAELDGRLRYSVAAVGLSDAFVIRPRPDGLIDAGPLLAALMGPDALAAALERYVAELPPSVHHAASAHRLAELRTELADLEESEEVEVLRLEALDQSPGRRGDADPAVVLKVRG